MNEIIGYQCVGVEDYGTFVPVEKAFAFAMERLLMADEEQRKELIDWWFGNSEWKNVMEDTDGQSENL